MADDARQRAAREITVNRRAFHEYHIDERSRRGSC